LHRWHLIWVRFGRLITGVVVVLLLIAASVVGYRMAISNEVETGSSEARAARAGAEQGEARGTREGFSEGFEATREDAYRQAYEQAYVAAYRGEFENAGLAVPEQVTVQEP
jgi:hypothetical protein